MPGEVMYPAVLPQLPHDGVNPRKASPSFRPGRKVFLGFWVVELVVLPWEISAVLVVLVLEPPVDVAADGVAAHALVVRYSHLRRMEAGTGAENKQSN
jgi:hypothetical protein